jgi:uncharacterized protein (TIGR02246 family)
MPSTTWATSSLARRAGLAGVTALLAFTGPLAGVTPSTAATAHVASTATVQATGQAGHPITEAGVSALLRTWSDTLLTGDPQKVADLYAPDAVLLPTISAQIRTERAGLVDYFTHFLAKEPRATVKQCVIELLGKNAAVDSGIYDFSLKNEDGERVTVSARFTFVYERIAGKWLIVSHHSSLVPSES